MNRKAEYINRIIDIVVECCSADIGGGRQSFTRDDLLGNSRAENVVMSRCILVMLILTEGYTVTTCSQILGMTPHAVRNLRNKGNDYQFSSRAFRIASSEATLKVEKERLFVDK